MNFALAAADMKNKENVCQLADRLNGRQFVLLWHPIDFDGLSLGAQLHERLVDSTVVTVPTTSTISRTGVHSDKIMCLAAPKETQATLCLFNGHPHMPREHIPWKLFSSQSACFAHIYAPASSDESPQSEGFPFLRYSCFSSIRTLLLSHV